MATCPRGHDCAADDYCEVCGARMSGPSSPVSPPDTGSTGTGSTGTGSTGSGSTGSGSAGSTGTGSAGSTGTVPTCPSCDSPLEGRFCERCGHDSLAAPTPPPTAATEPPPVPTIVARSTVEEDPSPGTVVTEGTGPWRMVVTADRDYFNRVQEMNGPEADSVEFPRFCPERRFSLNGEQVLIGRRSRSRGVYPDVDLTGPPEDGAVSHSHALLLHQPDGTWAVVDLQSRNCTYVNGGAQPIETGTPMPLRDGDHLNIGAWTRLTLRASIVRTGKGWHG